MTWLKAQLHQGILGTGWQNIGVCALLAIAVWVTSKGYAALNHGPAVLFVKTPLDDLLPVIPLFVIPYVSLEPLIYASLVVLLLFRPRIFQSAALSMILAWIVCYTVYAFLQTFVDRPVLTSPDPLTGMIRQVYAQDNPYNDLPSLHTTLSTIFAIHWGWVDRRIGRLVAIWVALIVASTLFVKQHYIPDVVAGLLVAFAAVWIAARLVAAWSPRVLPDGGAL